MMKKEKDLIVELKKLGLTLSLAESITGGYVSYLLTKIPGASNVLKASLVVYGLESKSILCSIDKYLLSKTQGVSEEVAAKLARYTAKKLKTDIGAAIVGFAGPSARSGVKIGTVYLAIYHKNKITAKKITLNGSRNNIRKKAACLFIDFIYEKVVS